MLDLNDLRLFVLIVENGGIGRTSRAINLAKSTISRRLAALEQHLNTTLIDRHCDEFALTDRGRDVYNLCRDVARAGQAAEEALSGFETELSGDIRLSLSSVILPLFPEIAEEIGRSHPAIRLQIEVADRRNNQPNDGFDIYLRVHGGQLTDSTLRQKRIIRHPLRLVAHPQYVRRKGLPYSPEALVHFDLLAFDLTEKPDLLAFTSGDFRQAQASFQPKLRSSNTELLLSGARGGIGIAVLPEFTCAAFLSTGELIDVLPDWHAEALAISLLTPPAAYPVARVQAVARIVEQFVRERLTPITSAQRVDFASASAVPKLEQAVAQLRRATSQSASYTFPRFRTAHENAVGGSMSVNEMSGENSMNPIFRAVGAALVTASSLLSMPAHADDTPGAIVVYTNDFEDVLRDRFKADTGRDAEIVQMSGGELLARIAAESANPQWDVVIFNGSNALQSLDDKDQLKRMVEPRNLANLNDIGKAQLPENKSWFPIGLAASCVLAYRTDLVEKAPHGFEDLVSAPFSGKVGMADPAVAAPAYPCVAQLFYSMGDEKARALFGGYFDNGLRVFRTNGPAGRALEAGDISVALLTSQVAYTLKNKGAPIEILWPNGGAPASVRGVGVQAKTKRPEASTAFVEWLLEANTQKYLQDSSGADGLFEATVTGVGRRADGPPEGSVYAVAPSDYAAGHEEAIKSWFADQAVR